MGRVNSHFIARFRERGPSDIDPEVVFHELQEAVAAGGGGVAERIRPARLGRSVWRFGLDGHGVYYAICEDATGMPVTFLSREEYVIVRDTLKGRATSALDAIDRRCAAETNRHALRRIRRLKCR